MDELKATDRTAPPGWVRRKKRVRVYEKGITLKRLLAILAAAAVVSLLLISLGELFENLEDKSYRPKDIERKYYEMQQMKEAAEKGRSPSSDR
jgi:glutamine synthetase adenylyltransferase